jgi:hypothetical protein
VTDPVLLTCSEVDELAGTYVLDALETDDLDAVREHLASHPGSHPEYAELGSVVPALFETIEPLDAPADLRARVLAAVAAAQPAAVAAAQPAELGSATIPVVLSAAPGVRAAPPGKAPTTRRAGMPDASTVTGAERQRDLTRGPWLSVLAVAAVLLIVALGGWNVLLQERAGTAENRVAIMRDAIAASADPSSEVAVLRGSGSAAGASGLAVFPSGRPGAIIVDGLPPASSGRTYQAWFLANGRPISAGLLSVGSDGLAVLSGVSPVAGADTVALTDEAAGGAPQPTGTPIVAGQMGHPAATAALPLSHG